MKVKWLQILPIFTLYLEGKRKHVFGSSYAWGSLFLKLDQLLILEPITISRWIDNKILDINDVNEGQERNNQYCE